MLLSMGAGASGKGCSVHNALCCEVFKISGMTFTRGDLNLGAPGSEADVAEHGLSARLPGEGRIVHHDGLRCGVLGRRLGQQGGLHHFLCLQDRFSSFFFFRIFSGGGGNLGKLHPMLMALAAGTAAPYWLPADVQP